MKVWILLIEEIKIKEIDGYFKDFGAKKMKFLVDKKTDELITFASKHTRETIYLKFSEAKNLELTTPTSNLEICFSKKEAFQKKSFLNKEKISSLELELIARKKQSKLEQVFINLWTKRF